jgi:two-component SAPR family response regulator
MYRLRHAVGQNSILFEGEHYRFNQELDYEYDVDHFKKYLEQARLATSPAERKSLLNSAIELVKGAYLADVDAEWADLERTWLENQYHVALLGLAGLHLEDKQAAEALRVCQTALKSDPLMEEAYRLSMRAYSFLEDGAAVTRVYQTCCAVLEEELGVKPSRETRNLYQKLI